MRRQHRSHLIRGRLLAATLFSVVASIFAGSLLPNPLHSSDPTAPSAPSAQPAASIGAILSSKT